MNRKGQVAEVARQRETGAQGCKEQKGWKTSGLQASRSIVAEDFSRQPSVNTVWDKHGVIEAKGASPFRPITTKDIYYSQSTILRINIVYSIMNDLSKQSGFAGICKNRRFSSIISIKIIFQQLGYMLVPVCLLGFGKPVGKS